MGLYLQGKQTQGRCVMATTAKCPRCHQPGRETNIVGRIVQGHTAVGLIARVYQCSRCTNTIPSGDVTWPLEFIRATDGTSVVVRECAHSHVEQDMKQNTIH